MSSHLNRMPHYGGRRQFLRWGMAAGGLAIAAPAARHFLKSNPPSARIPAIELERFAVPGIDFNPMSLVRDFDYGVVKQENGRTGREF